MGLNSFSIESMVNRFLMVCFVCDGRSVLLVVISNCCYGCGVKKFFLYYLFRVAVCSILRSRIGFRMSLRFVISSLLKKLSLARIAKRGRSGISA